MNIMAMRWGKLYEGTPAEKSLEPEVAALGVPYRTQFPGWKYGLRYFPDFILPTLRLVIEVDDDSHNRKATEDLQRTAEIYRVWGYKVVRCTNEEALSTPRSAVRRMLSEVGMWPIPDKRPALDDALPKLRKASQKQKREARSKTRQRARGIEPIDLKFPDEG